MLDRPDVGLLEDLSKMIVAGVVLTCGEDIPDPADFDILVCGVPAKEAIEASPNLKMLIIPWSGLPRKTRDLMLAYPNIEIYNIHHNALPAAEMAITLMLAVAKDLIPIDRALRKGDWSKRYNTSLATTLAGRKALIVGYGAIGREIAARCFGLGMTVSAVKTGETDQAEPNVKVHPSTALHHLLADADVLFLSLPLTEATEGLIGDRELCLLPDGAIVVNISRGRIVDEEALFKHLGKGRLRAGLDVWYAYPDKENTRKSTRPSAYRFEDLPNVVMTPHLAGHCDRTEHLRARELARLINLAARGHPLPNRVNPKAGY